MKHMAHFTECCH